MPLWLDLLRTPMAAPESDSLRGMRRTWQVLCVTCAFAVFLISPIAALAGKVGTFTVAALLGTTALYTALYGFRKHRIDEDYIHGDRAEPGDAA